MKNAALSLILAFTSVTAFANEYDCSTADQSVTGHLIFDDGPGGLDVVDLTAFGKNYSDAHSGEEGVIKITDRDTFKGTYDYASEDLEIGFTADDGLKLDILTTSKDSAHFTGKLYVTKGSKKKALALTCIDQEAADAGSEADSSN